MEEPEKGFSTCGNSAETSLVGETLDGSQVQVLDDVICGEEDLKSVGVGDGTEARLEDSIAVEFEQGRSEKAEMEVDSAILEREVGDQVVVGGETCPVVETNSSSDNGLGYSSSVLGENVQCKSGTEDLKSVAVGDGTEVRVDDSIDVESEQGRSEKAEVEFDSVISETKVGDQVVVGGDSCTVVETTPGVETNSSCDNGLGCSSSVLGENVECKSEGKGTVEDCNYVRLEGLDEEKNMGGDLLRDDKILDEGAFVCEKVEIEGELNSNLEQPLGNDKVDGNSNNVDEVVCRTEVEMDETLLKSDEKQSSGNEEEQIIADKDVSCVSGLDVSDVEQSDVHTGMEIDVEEPQAAERSETMNHTAEINGSSVSFGSEENLDANVIVEKGTQITDQVSHVTLIDGNEKFNDESNMSQNVEERECVSEQVGSDGGLEIKEVIIESGQSKETDGKTVEHALVKHGSSEIVDQARYLLPIEKKEGEFSLSDMVWGKVRSHPWWPGQIFDPSDASDRAMKHYKKDFFFVAYFGDRTFAWNEASQLKHFRAHFSTIEKQRSSSESFQNAIDCALEEVSRRVEYGLACSCIPKDTYDTIKNQTVENTGVRQEIRFRHGVDESLNANSFSPSKLIEYVKTLSELPTAGFDRMELVIAKAQLLALNRFKGFSCLPEIQYCVSVDKDNSFVDDEHATPVVDKDDQAGTGNFKNQSSTRQKRKHNFKDTMHPTKKEKRMSNLMNGSPDSPDGDGWTPDNQVSPEHSKKRSAIDPYDDDFEMQDGTKTISVPKVSNTTRSSFKIGDCIRRAASQLTASPSMLKCSSERSQKTDGDIDGLPENGLDFSLPTSEDEQNTTEYSSLDDLLSSLQLVALEPLEKYSFLKDMISFFSDFRNSVIVAADSGKDILHEYKVGTKRKKPPISGSPETFEFEDMSDTYWTDRVIDNEEKPVQQPSRKNQKKDEHLVAAKLPKPAAKSPKPAQVNRKPYTKKKNSDSNHAETPEKPPGYIDENAPAELVMNFAELNSVPSEANLNRMFKRFGPLKESETEVDRVSSRARVVFKKCMDAEVAFSSATKFNIFGSVPVNYQLNYTPSALFKASSGNTTQDPEILFDLSNFEVSMV